MKMCIEMIMKKTSKDLKVVIMTPLTKEEASNLIIKTSKKISVLYSANFEINEKLNLITTKKKGMENL